jgi:hypothetical protein
MYQIRKCQRIVIFQSGPIANVDPEKFRNLSTPYTGNSEEDFLNYLTELDFDEIYDELDEDTSFELSAFYSPEDWSEYANSLDKGEDSWNEIGKENEEWRKTGGFEILHSTE